MEESLEDRLAALERAVTDGDRDLTGLTHAVESGERIEALEADLSALEDRVAELEAATQALRGYVGHVRSVNEDVEKRADLALSKAEAAEGDAPGTARPVAGAETTAGAPLGTDAERDAVEPGGENACPRCGERKAGGPGQSPVSIGAVESAERDGSARGLLDRMNDLL